MADNADTSSISSSRKTIHAVTETLGWAAYLACSWTWCIGLFLPVLLVREFGVRGWVAFAVPNIIGAALFGWIIRDGDASRRFVGKHRLACEVFSAVTIAFQIVFIGSFLTPMVGKLIVILPIVT